MRHALVGRVLGGGGHHRAAGGGARRTTVKSLAQTGCVPYFLPEAIAAKTINTRGESVADKPCFRTAFGRRRCIVPINGFYEWQTVAGGKQPFYIHPVGEEFFGLAGLWERWMRPADGESIDTFTLITTTANAAIRPLHERMPVILAPADYTAWLSADTAPDQVQRLIQPCPEGLLAAHPVSTAVGNVRNEGSELIRAV